MRICNQIGGIRIFKTDYIDIISRFPSCRLFETKPMYITSTFTIATSNMTKSDKPIKSNKEMTINEKLTKKKSKSKGGKLIEWQHQRDEQNQYVDCK